MRYFLLSLVLGLSFNYSVWLAAYFMVGVLAAVADNVNNNSKTKTHQEVILVTAWPSILVILFFMWALDQ